jgi:hypothetical protein
MRRFAPLVVLLALGLAACSSDERAQPDPAATTTTTTGAPTSTTGRLPDLGPGPSIASFTGPPSPVECSAPTSVELSWETPVTATVELRIDGGDVFASYPGGKGTHLVPLECDGKAQTYEITVTGANGSTASKSLTIEERVLAT